MASKVEICNLALARVGANRITSLTDNLEEARLCNLMYPTIADEVMAEGPWSRTLARASLAATSNTPTYGYDNEFQLPTVPVLLRVLSINESIPGNVDYRIEGDKLLTDESTIKIRYIGRIEDPASYGPYLTKAIVSRLAAELAYTLTANAAAAERLMERYRIDVAEGLALDGQQGKADTWTSDTFLEIR